MTMQLGCDRIGAGASIVLLHPLGADRHVWDAVAERLGERYEVIALDLPGFGESFPLPDEPTPLALAGAVAAFLAEQGVVRPHVAGNSLGGWVALELALTGCARSATAIAPAGLWPEPLMPKRGAARQLAQLVRPLVGPLSATAPGRRVLLGGVVARPERVTASAAAHLVRSYASAPGFIEVNAAMRARRFEGLERIRVPVTLLWGEHDRLVARPEWVPANIEERLLSGAGHLAMLEAPEEVAAQIAMDAAAGTVTASGRTGARRAAR
ncbi:MAG: alpha/beta fold hydrolase [Solirubrobacteraceae bacterium]